MFIYLYSYTTYYNIITQLKNSRTNAKIQGWLVTRIPRRSAPGPKIGGCIS